MHLRWSNETKDWATGGRRWKSKHKSPKLLVTLLRLAFQYHHLFPTSGSLRQSHFSNYLLPICWLRKHERMLSASNYNILWLAWLYSLFRLFWCLFLERMLSITDLESSLVIFVIVSLRTLALILFNAFLLARCSARMLVGHSLDCRYNIIP